MKKNYFLTFLFFILFSTLFVQAQNTFEHGMWEWVSGSKITDKRLNEIAPHFPKPEQYNYDFKAYDNAIRKWEIFHCYEYEAFVNAPELTALNPYYTGYVDIVQLPYFLGPLESYNKPIYKDTGNKFDDELAYELAVQNWYFVFHPNEFKRLYDMKLDFPDTFNADEYRQKIIKKIEDNKNSESLNSKAN